MDSTTSDTAISHLRAAAEGVRIPATHEDLHEASADLASAMQNIGLERWPEFLNDAADRAEAYQPANGRIILAQATTTKMATDASPGRSSTAAPRGGYVADNPERWAGQPSVGTGECVALVQQATGAPHSTQWRRGEQVQGNTDIPRGTAIATFDSNGRNTGHEAIYLGQNARA